MLPFSSFVSCNNCFEVTSAYIFIYVHLTIFLFWPEMFYILFFKASSAAFFEKVFLSEVD